jgi:DNA-directed RNA polymerase subunit RPC12/RpoP
MVVNLTCPTCGHKFRLPENTQGQQARCPACLNSFANPPAPVPSLLARSTPVEPAAAQPPAPNRTMLAESEPMIHYSCPRCKKPLESPVSFAGQKLNCPDCSQRLQIPQPSKPPPQPINKTVLAQEEPPTRAAGPSGSRPQPTLAPPPSAVPTLTVQLVEDSSTPASPTPPAQRETCLECGRDVTNRARLQTCPDCGALFCSATCYRDHRYHAHAPKPKPRTQYVECGHCGSTARPYRSTVISQSGWITFVLLLIFFFPLFWIGLLMTEMKYTCSDCGVRIN